MCHCVRLVGNAHRLLSLSTSALSVMTAGLYRAPQLGCRGSRDDEREKVIRVEATIALRK